MQPSEYDMHTEQSKPRKPWANILPRLDRSAYQSDAVILWTLTTHNRTKDWLTKELHQQFREILLHTLARHELLCPVYTIMPDHIHLVWMGLEKEADQRKAMAFFRTHFEPALKPAKFQPQAHDHVLRESERKRNAFTCACQYVIENPMRAGLAKSPCSWPFTGTVISGYPTISPFQDDFWKKFWSIYQTLKNPECGKHIIVRKFAPKPDFP